MSKNKIALITGANKGIGLETARQLGALGFTVLVAGRSLEKVEQAVGQLKGGGADARALALDVTASASIAAAVKSVTEEFGRLDVLINNAGVAADDPAKPVSEQSLETWRRTFETNLFGLVAVTQGFLPLLHQSEAGRIVNLSSILGSLTLHSDPQSPIYDFKLPAYNASKSAVNAFTVHLAYELRATKIKVNAAHPGWVKTEMGGAEAPLEVEEGAKTSVQLATVGPDGPTGAFLHLGQALPW